MKPQKKVLLVFGKGLQQESLVNLGFDLVLTMFNNKSVVRKNSFAHVATLRNVKLWHMDIPRNSTTRSIGNVKHEINMCLDRCMDENVHFSICAVQNLTDEEKFFFLNVIQDLQVFQRHAAHVKAFLFHENSNNGMDLTHFTLVSDDKVALHPLSFFFRSNDMYWRESGPIPVDESSSSASDLEVDDNQTTQSSFEYSDSDSYSDPEDDIPLVSFESLTPVAAASNMTLVRSVLPRGVYNPGNKCYFISVMQAIAHCAIFPVLANHSCIGSAKCLAKLCYDKVLMRLNSNDNKVQNLKLSKFFWKSFAKLVPEHMRDDNQEDAEEMLVAFCGSLNECESKKSNEPSQLQQLLQITYLSKDTCQSGCLFEKNETTDTLSVVIIGDVSIQDMINDYFRTEKLTPENAHTCNCVQWKTISHYRSLEPMSLGNLLVVHLRRYEFIRGSNRFERLSAKIDISERISVKEIQYRVCAIVCHSTTKNMKSVNNGHYYCLMRKFISGSSESEWVHASDKDVRVANPEDLENAQQECTLVFYQHEDLPSVTNNSNNTTTTQVKTHLILLAMTPSCDSDTIRVIELLKQPNYYYVTTINSCTVTQTIDSQNWTHEVIDFSVKRGKQALLGYIQNVVLESSRIVVALDFMFLMAQYYQERYGVSWFNPWGKNPDGTEGPPFVQALLDAGADEIWLPENKPSDKRLYGEIGTMLIDLFPGENVYENRILNGLKFTWHHFADHPSFRATNTEEVNNAFMLMRPQKLGARGNVDRYLHEGVNGVSGRCMLCVTKNPDYNTSDESEDDSIDVRSIF